MLPPVDWTQKPVSLAIPVLFGGPQPNHFGASPATAEPMRAGDFVGDTRKGGSCNAQEIRYNPHCNGTHTESISHVTDELVAPHEVVSQPLMMAYVLSVRPTADHQGSDYEPALEPGDELITDKHLTAVSKSIQQGVNALIIRTLPNGSDKLSRTYNGSQQPPFFSHQAMQWLAQKTDITHLLVDMPSVDRLHDDGLLSNHRIFWNLPRTGHQITTSAWRHKTITEMIYVPDEIEDGAYVLDLQLPRFNLNAVPSNPLLYAIKGNHRL